MTVSTTLTLAAAEIGVILAQNPNETGPEFGKASPFGLVIILGLLVATFFLIRSMNARLRKLPVTFDRNEPSPDQAADEGTDRGAVQE